MTAEKFVGDVLTRGKRRRALYGEERLSLFNENQMEELKPKEEKEIHLSQEDAGSSPKSSASQNRLRDEVSQYTWVQCDNLDCMKWRKILNTDAEKLDTESKWFCHMNLDEAYNNCLVAEEDYTVYEKMAAKCKMKFVLSVLPLGELVWAKMPGYCRWPAMITKDPVLDDFVTFGKHGEPEWYHVEFLGREHTHSWTRASSTTPYGHRDPQELSSKGSKGRPKLTMSSDKGCKRKYKSFSVADAVKEAESMLKLGASERLERCVYQETPSILSQELNIAIPKSDVFRRTNGSDRGGGNKKRNICISAKKPREDRSKMPQTKMTSATNQCKNGAEYPNEKQPSWQSDSLQSCFRDQRRAASPRNASREPFVVPNIGSGIGSLTNMNIGSMATMSKEEKLTFDIENYRRNEQAFNHDLQRFLARNDRKLSRLPFWQNTVVSVFSLFENVVDRGGFHQVCKLGKWNSVYREVVATDCRSSGGICAKKYYESNLLAYEMFLAGKEFKEYLVPKARKPGRKAGQQKEEVDMPSKTVKGAETDDDPDPKFDHDISELEEMLDKLEEVSDQCELYNNGPSAQKLVKEIPPLCFGGDTPPPLTRHSITAADVASEFGFSPEPEESAQTVPVVDFEDSSSGSGEEELLHEMQAMEQVFDEMDQMPMTWL